MKKHILILIAGIISLSISGQNTTHYNDGVTKFEADEAYGAQTDWHQVFSDYHQKMYKRPVGKYRKIITDNAGNTYMTQKTKHTIYKFSADGKKTVNIGSHGSGEGQFPMLPEVQGVLDGKYIYTTDVQGRVRLFNLDGTFYKNAQIDYMPLNTVALKNKKIAILGHVPLGGGDVRNIISIKNIITGKEQVVWKKDRTREQDEEKTIVVNLEGKGMISFNQIFSNPGLFNPHIASTTNGNLIIAFPKSGKVEVYSPDGSKINSFKMEIEPLKITETDRKDYYEAALQKAKVVEKSIKESTHYDKKEQQQLIDGYYRGVEMLKDPGYYPSNLPYFAELLIDDSNNLWVVKYSPKEAAESFQLYSFSEDGEYLGTSKVESENYKIVLNPDQIQFHKGKVIAVVLDKNDKKIPLRLKKFHLK
ncbi:NHL repeat-containing protein [Salinivirga cyanobacteriivorans]